MKYKFGLIGIGKMGISHLAIANSHPLVDVVAVADPSSLVLHAIKLNPAINVYADYHSMFSNEKLDAVVISVPTKFHETVVRDAVISGYHTFVEKPFCLNADVANELITIVKEKKLVNQVGYHNRFVGTFIEAQKLLRLGGLGKITHFEGLAAGPVILKKKKSTWRSSPDEGGGCLMDYAAHLIDLIHFLIGNIQSVKGSDLFSIFSEKVDDAVFAIVRTDNNVHGKIYANWSDETYRKMHTGLVIFGTKGKLEVDSSELKVFFSHDPSILGYEKGWNIKSINFLASAVEYYLRGEEYSLQMDHFITAIHNSYTTGVNTFHSAYQTDRVIQEIKKCSIN